MHDNKPSGYNTRIQEVLKRHKLTKRKHETRLLEVKCWVQGLNPEPTFSLRRHQHDQPRIRLSLDFFGEPYDSLIRRIIRDFDEEMPTYLSSYHSVSHTHDLF